MTKKKEDEIKSPMNIKLSDFIGRKLIDISGEDGKETKIKVIFDNGYTIKLSGNVVISKEIHETE